MIPEATFHATVRRHPDGGWYGYVSYDITTSHWDQSGVERTQRYRFKRRAKRELEVVAAKMAQYIGEQLQRAQYEYQLGIPRSIEPWVIAPAGASVLDGNGYSVKRIPGDTLKT